VRLLLCDSYFCGRTGEGRRRAVGKRWLARSTFAGRCAIIWFCSLSAEWLVRGLAAGWGACVLWDRLLLCTPAGACGLRCRPGAAGHHVAACSGVSSEWMLLAATMLRLVARTPTKACPVHAHNIPGKCATGMRFALSFSVTLVWPGACTKPHPATVCHRHEPSGFSFLVRGAGFPSVSSQFCRALVALRLAGLPLCWIVSWDELYGTLAHAWGVFPSAARDTVG